MISWRLRSLARWLLCLLPAILHANSAPGRPNLIVIIADDLGYSDLGCYGGELSTPSLDRLSREGVRLTHCFNGGMCVVSRASLFTGQWWPRALPAFARTPILPEELKKSGYRTALIGKWHLRGHPMDRGFDHFFGFLDGFADHFTGSRNYRLDREPFTAFGPDYYSSDAFTERAVAFIQSPSSAARDAPFFLTLSFQAPHNPLQAPAADIARHRGKYLDGWQAVRESRIQRQKHMGLLSPDATLPAPPHTLPDWNTLTSEQRDLEDLRMAVYAAMVERMDQGIGRVLDALEATGQRENTLILFFSDNGTDPFSAMDGSLLERGVLPGDRRSNFQPGNGWAYASVTPWRLYKISQHAGGVTSGAIAWWPQGVRSPGRIETSPIHLIDVLPTLLDAAHSPSSTRAIAGESFLPLLRGQRWKREQPLFFQYMDNRALRTEDWTLAEVDGEGWELYHTASDPLETTNVAALHPDRVSALDERWLAWWRTESGQSDYTPKSTRTGPNYKPQGDRGSGQPYQPSAMPIGLRDRLPLPRDAAGSGLRRGSALPLKAP